MEREIQIRIIGNKDGKKNSNINDFLQDNLGPLINFIQESSDEDDSSEKGDRFSIEDVESALFCECEEGLPNIKEVEYENSWLD